jgi:hypothetical protein
MKFTPRTTQIATCLRFQRRWLGSFTIDDIGVFCPACYMFGSVPFVGKRHMHMPITLLTEFVLLIKMFMMIVLIQNVDCLLGTCCDHLTVKVFILSL